jgi:hypothetical protein
MAQLVTERDRPGGNQRDSLKDRKLPTNDDAYVRDVMARFDQIGFDDCQPSTAKHRILQETKH